MLAAHLDLYDSDVLRALHNHTDETPGWWPVYRMVDGRTMQEVGNIRFTSHIKCSSIGWWLRCLRRWPIRMRSPPRIQTARPSTLIQ